MTQYNLLREKWIPVRRKSRAVELVAPHELTSAYISDPIVEIVAHRPDFNAMLLQFLIGIVQTTRAPEDKREWRSLLSAPPAPHELLAVFSPYEEAFNLTGDGPRFMQDIDASLDTSLEEVVVNRLLITEPGEQAEKFNKDHFVKRSTGTRFSLRAAAMALMTMQLNAPAGGQGHRTSLRGGGPLTTLVCGVTLWEDVWSNVLEPSRLGYDAGEVDQHKHLIFPWLAPTITSEEDRQIEPVSSHPLLNYWACPRRIRLQFVPDPGTCFIFGSNEQPLVCKGYVTKNYGSKFSENWLHPLTPYRKGKEEGLFYSVKPPAHGMSFHHWLGVVSDQAGVVPAPVIQRIQASGQAGASRIRCVGYAMDNMKPLNWIESEFPLYLFDTIEKARQFGADLAKMVSAAEEALSCLKVALKAGQPDQAPLVSTRGFEKLKRQFFNALEDTFFLSSADLASAGEEGRVAIKLRWIGHLGDCCTKMYDDMLVDGAVAATEPSRPFGGRSFLRALLRKKRGKLEEILELPLSEMVVVQKKSKIKQKVVQPKEVAV